MIEGAGLFPVPGHTEDRHLGVAAHAWPGNPLSRSFLSKPTK